MKKTFLAAGLVLCTLAFAVAGRTAAPVPDASLYDALAKFHGHRCAGSLLAAKAALGDKTGKGKVRAAYDAAACPLDGIQVSTGCTLGNGTIESKGKKEMRLVLTVDGVPGAVEAKPTPEATKLGGEFKDLSKKAKELAKGSPERVRIEARMDEVLKTLESAPEEDLVILKVSR